MQLINHVIAVATTCFTKQEALTKKDLDPWASAGYNGFLNSEETLLQ